MAVISTLLASLGFTAAAAAVNAAGTAFAASAVGGFLGSIGAGLGVGGVATSGGMAGVYAGTSILAGALAAGTIATTAAIGLGSMYQSSRASAKAQAAQAEAIKKLQENTGTTGVSKVTSGLQDNNSRINRTLSSLRVSMLPQAKDNEQITQNVYGVDTNTVATSTQNMTGLNIATA